MTHVRTWLKINSRTIPLLVEDGRTGLHGIVFPEKYDGLGLGKVELILLTEEAGRALLPGPFWSTVALQGP